jgi:hypothetical protein
VVDVGAETMTDYYDITEAMLTYGGAFVRALAAAYRVADIANQRRLKDAFPEYWAEYRDLAERAQKNAVDAGASEDL